MSQNRYEVRRARRRRENERNLCGETLADFHRRENPPREAPGAGIPRVRCPRTPSLFGGIEAAEYDRDKWEEREPARTGDLFGSF